MKESKVNYRKVKGRKGQERKEWEGKEKKCNKFIYKLPPPVQVVEHHNALREVEVYVLPLL